MPSRIEDYGVIGNCETLALVGRDGSIDWLCQPRFDSPACFAALLGTSENGRFLLAPASGGAATRRRYRDSTLILETDFETETGTVRIIDFMVRRNGASDVVRKAICLRGSVAMRAELVARFYYGKRVPWVTRTPDNRLQFIAGPARLLLDSNVELRGENMRSVADFTLAEGGHAYFSLTWTQSWEDPPPPLDIGAAERDVEQFWRGWSSACTFTGPYKAETLRSLLVLKALSHWRTGGIVAAGTASLPEKLGGARNWDYRFCWLRDATFTLYALVESGFLGEARAWRDWLLRAVAGSPDDLQIMYGIAGEARLTESEIPWLAGYENSKPIRIGNAAADQLQLDVYGEVLDMLYAARKAGLPESEASWSLERALVNHLVTIWHLPDHGIWEVRGGKRHFTQSKVMCWVAFDRAIRSAREFNLPGEVDTWTAARDAIHAEICARAFHPGLNAFTQSYDSDALDAAALLIPIVGLLPPEDARVRGTLAAIEKHLLQDGFVLRYRTEESKDGLPAGEGVFLACSFWLADNYVLQGRHDDARALFHRLLGLRNDLGLFSEEYDPAGGRALGNFPQALSHLALINTARNLAGGGPARQRSGS